MRRKLSSFEELQDVMNFDIITDLLHTLSDI